MSAAKHSPFAESLALLGERIRAVRQTQKVSTEVLSGLAGISRPTLHRIERGDSGVAIGSWVAVAEALGLKLGYVQESEQAASPKFSTSVRLDDYPELKQLAWHLHGVAELSPLQALELYERNWRHVDKARLSMKELELIDALTRTIGGGRLLV